MELRKTFDMNYLAPFDELVKAQQISVATNEAQLVEQVLSLHSAVILQVSHDTDSRHVCL